MAISWLPYGTPFPSHVEGSWRDAKTAVPSFSPLGGLLAPRWGRKPPVGAVNGGQPAGAGRPSFRPAVAIPAMLGVMLGATLVWASLQGPAPRNLPEVDPAHQAPMSAPALSAFLPASVRDWTSDIDRWAEAFGLPVDLVAVVMTLESCGDPTVRSSAGAQGLFQVMPFHFAADEDPNDPEVNARRGLAYLSRGLVLASGDEGLAMAGYNGGHSLIGRDPSTWPTETTRYVRWGQGILGDIRAGLAASPTLQAWLDAGGAQLCRRAGAAG